MPRDEPEVDKAGVNPQPGVRSIALYSRLNYEPWFALAEFVDNAIESYRVRRKAIRSVEPNDFVMRIEIHIKRNGRDVVVRDNAGGIHSRDYARAFTPAAPPPDQSGLSEFGIGMKSAACWFCNRWDVATSSIGEPFQRFIEWDVREIVENDTTRILPKRSRADENEHFTEIRLHDLYRPLRGGRTIGKIKDHLTSIYRGFLRTGEVEIVYNDERLDYKEPKILTAPPYNDEDGDSVEWRKEIDFEFGDEARATGFAALRDEGNTKKAGFALLRRGRIVEGSGDEAYRPEEIFGQRNSFRQQRLFGEFRIHGLEVSHQKDKLIWADSEGEFLDKLKRELEAEPLNLLRQAENYRKRAATKKLRQQAAGAMDAAMAALEERTQELQTTVTRQAKVIEKEATERPRKHSEILEEREFTIHAQRIEWVVQVQLIHRPEQSEWLDVEDRTERRKGGGHQRHVTVRMSAVHPFVVRFGQGSPEALEALLRMAIAFSIGELAARDSGTKHAGRIRHVANEILRNALSGAA